MLDKIYAEQKTISRNLQQISNIILMVFFANLKTKAKSDNDENLKKICHIGLILTAISHGLVVLSRILDLVDTIED